MELKEIQKLPTSIDKIHESCFRSYHVLQQVLIMVGRGDSIQTIVEVYELLTSAPPPDNNSASKEPD